MTTTTETNRITLPEIRDERAGFQGELARLQATVAELTAVVAAKDQVIQTLRTEQITEGDDIRLETFWEKAGRIADHADFCSEYDRMAEAMGGPRRERDYDVQVSVTVEIIINTSVSATDNEGAETAAEEQIDTDYILSHIRDYGISDWEITETEVA